MAKVIGTTLQTSSSSMTQGRVLLSPKLIHPKMGTETWRPELPRRRYSTFVFSTDSLSLGGMFGVDMMARMNKGDSVQQGVE